MRDTTAVGEKLDRREIKVIKKVVAIILICSTALFCCACRETQGETESSVSTMPSSSDIESMTEESSEVATSVEEGALGELVKYETLTEENLEEVLTTFMFIQNEEELWKLEYLPLTETLYERCIQNFPYARDVENFEKLGVYQYGVNEDAVGCYFVIETKNNIAYDYYIKFLMDDDKIKGMDLLLIGFNS